MTKVDQNRAKLRGKVMPAMVPGVIPGFPEMDWEATSLVSTSQLRAEQQAIKEGVNTPSITQQLSRENGRQVPNPESNASVFQPTPARIVGDMVTGPDPKAGDLGRTQIDAIVTGTLMAGGDFPRARGPRVPLKDWPKDETKTFVQNAPNPK